MAFFFINYHHAKADQPSPIYNEDFHRTGNLGIGPQNDPHKYDYLESTYHIPAIICMTQVQCASELVEVKAMSQTECNNRRDQLIWQYMIKWSYERVIEIRECIQ